MTRPAEESFSEVKYGVGGTRYLAFDDSGVRVMELSLTARGSRRCLLEIRVLI